MVSVSDLFNQFDNSVPEIMAWKPRVGIEKSGGAGQRQVLERLRAAYRGSIGQALIVRADERGDRYTQYFGNSRQAAGTDAVGTFLIFLHLLERKAKGLGEGTLRHATGVPFDPNAMANLDVNGVRCFLRHGHKFRRSHWCPWTML